MPRLFTLVSIVIHSIVLVLVFVAQTFNIGPLPMPQWFTAGWKVVYVIVMRLLTTILGNVLMWSGTVLYTVYAKGEAERLKRVHKLQMISVSGRAQSRKIRR